MALIKYTFEAYITQIMLQRCYGKFFELQLEIQQQQTDVILVYVTTPNMSTTCPSHILNIELHIDSETGGDKLGRTNVSSERAQTITVYVNGNQNFLGRKLIVNRRRIRTWDALLGSVTETTGGTAAVREIVTPEHGTRLRTLDQLQDKASYVAITNGDFKPIRQTFYQSL